MPQARMAPDEALACSFRRGGDTAALKNPFIRSVRRLESLLLCPLPFGENFHSSRACHGECKGNAEVLRWWGGRITGSGLRLTMRCKRAVTVKVLCNIFVQAPYLMFKIFSLNQG